MTTLLISVGGARYPNAPALRHDSFARSSSAIATFLTDGETALLRPENHLDLFDDYRAWPEQLMAIRAWLRCRIQAHERLDSPDRVRNVLVHYVGHGMFKPNSEEHYLSINATDAEDRSMTSASLSQLNDILVKNAPKQRRIYLIDACFAAASLRNLMGPAEDAIEVSVGGILGAWPEGEEGERGVAALCSADRTATANAGGERKLTQFTDGLLTVFESGDKETKDRLSLRHVYQLLRRALRERYREKTVHPVLVSPQDRDGGIAGAPIFPNLAKSRRGSDRLERSTETAGPEAPTSRCATGEADSPGAGAALDDAAGRGSTTAGPATSDSRCHTDGTMVPETIGTELSGWNVAIGNDAAVGKEATLSPEHRFRQAVYRFFRLPRSKKDEIANKLDPSRKVESALPDFERYKLLLAQVRASGAIAKLETMILKAEGE